MADDHSKIHIEKLRKEKPVMALKKKRFAKENEMGEVKRVLNLAEPQEHIRFSLLVMDNYIEDAIFFLCN